MLRALFPQAVFMPKQKAVHTPILIQSKTFTANLEALIDSGATENFISPNVVSYFSIPAQDLPNPRTIRNVDGTKNSIGEVTQVAYLQIHHQGKANTHPFFIIQWVKKLSQCLAVSERVVCNKFNKLHKNIKILYAIV